MSNPISEFYDVIWTFKKGFETIDALYNGELTLESYAEMLYNKRKAYDAYILDCRIEKLDEIILSTTYQRLNSQLEKYSFYDFNKVVEEGTKAYWELEYHKVRYKELSTAIKNTKDLISSNKIIEKDKEYIGNNFYYRGLYNDAQLEIIYNHLLYKYLHPDTKLEDFIYYMTGRGDNIPSIGMIWLKDKDELAYFIDTFCDCGKKYKIASHIFGKDRLASAIYQSKKENPFKSLEKDIKNLAKTHK